MLLARRDDLVDVLERDDAHHRSEDFLAGDLHVVLHVVEDGRRDEVAAIADAFAAAEQLGAFALAGVDVAHDLLELLVGDLRSLLGRRIERIADLAVLGEREHLVHELVMNRLFDEQPAAGTAALALVEEQAEVRALRRPRRDRCRQRRCWGSCRPARASRA